MEYLQNDERTKAVSTLTQVWGVGLSNCNKLYRTGMRTIEDLTNNSFLLNSNQKIGLKYFEDSQMRIPYEEVTDIFNAINKCLYEVLSPELVDSIVCGSYRRLKSTSGHIDILITRKDDGKVEGLLDSLLEKLRNTCLITDSFAFSKTYKSKNQFNGVCRLNEDMPHRRIDIKVILF